MNQSRRGFVLAAAGALAAQRAASGAPRVRPPVTISRQPEYYHGWPTLALRKNGDMLLAYSGGRESHVCPFGRVELMRSRDEGATWSWPEVLMDSPIDDRDAGIVETPSGALLVTTFTSLAYEAVSRAKWPPERVDRWEAVQRRATPEQRKALLGTWMLRSAGGGMTWSAPYRVPLNSPHGPVPISGGRLLYAGKRLWEPGDKTGVCVSQDDGSTWRWLSDIPARPGDSVTQYHELHAVETANGALIVHIRNHNPANANEILQCESDDGGQTWTAPHPIGVWGLPSHLLRLKDGRLLMSYGYRRAPFGIQARLSSDRGKTWSDPIVVYGDGAGPDLGYPSTVQLPAGDLFTAWYELPKDSSRAVLRAARWSLVVG